MPERQNVVQPEMWYSHQSGGMWWFKANTGNLLKHIPVSVCTSSLFWPRAKDPISFLLHSFVSCLSLVSRQPFSAGETQPSVAAPALADVSLFMFGTGPVRVSTHFLPCPHPATPSCVILAIWPTSWLTVVWFSEGTSLFYFIIYFFPLLGVLITECSRVSQVRSMEQTGTPLCSQKISHVIWAVGLTLSSRCGKAHHSIWLHGEAVKMK